MQALLYVAVFASSLLIGRRVEAKVDRALTVTVYLVVFTVSFWGSNVLAGHAAIYEMGRAILYTTLITLYTVILGYIVDRGKVSIRENTVSVPWKIWLIIAVGLVSGATFGQGKALPINRLVEMEVTVLIFLAGLDAARKIRKEILGDGFKLALKSVFTAVVAGVLAAITASAMLGASLRVSLLYTWGMGWYSFSGPFTATNIGVKTGFSVFIANLFKRTVHIHASTSTETSTCRAPSPRRGNNDG